MAESTLDYKARILEEEGRLHELPRATTYAAVSTSDPSIIYMVTVLPLSSGNDPRVFCTCPAGSEFKNCHHAIAALNRHRTGI